MSAFVQRSQWSVVTSEPADAAELVTRIPDVRRATVEGAPSGFSFEERRRGSELLSLVSMASTGVVEGTVEAETARSPMSWGSATPMIVSLRTTTKVATSSRPMTILISRGRASS